MADGNFPQLPTTPRSRLALTKADLDRGRARALSMWNATDTDADTAQDMVLSAGTAVVPGLQSPVDVSMVEDAAYAFAVIEAAARADSVNTTLQATGLAPEVAQQLARALPAAQQVARDYGKWVVAAKTRLAAIHLGI